MRALLITAGISAVIITGLGVALAGANARGDRFEKLDGQHRACVASLGRTALPDTVRKLCPERIAVHWAVSVRAQACDDDLTADRTFGIKAACSTPVKTVWAARNTAQANLTNTKAELAQERAGRKAAVARATSDATLQAERKTHRESIDKTAPRDPAGRVVCDAQCVRDRFGP
ncbi:MAG: hypothetical protein GC145_14470 [Caulobacter sp.]|nr:hypothetical protein [Caulobacter sp.]